MINFLKKYWLIIAILVLALFLRFYKLDSYPALNADEAAIGYNAYSLIQTGKDEHGNSWPIHFQSFNDYKPGLYFYVVLPFVKLIGLNEWAVRIPGAAFGVLTVFAIYFLSKELFKNEKIAALTALFLAISPWHIQFSRGGWEVNLATFLMTSGVLYFLKGRNNSKLTIVSALLFVLSLYAYHAARIIAPLLGMGLTLIYRKEILNRKNWKFIFIGILLVVTLVAPLTIDLVKGDVLSRAAGVGLFADKGPVNRINEQRGEHESVASLSTKLLHNKAVNYGLTFLDNWVAHYHGLFLFISGDDIQRDKVPETGQMYLVDILFVLAGIFFLIRSQTQEIKSKLFIFYSLLIAPIAAALTFQAPHALRSQNMVIPLVMISAFGFYELIGWLKAKNLKVGIWLLVILIAWGFARYQHMYWVHMAKEYPFSSQYGVKELVSYVSENQSKYSDIFVTNRYDQPYILFLFYMRYSPRVFQANHTLTSRDDFGFSTVADFDKYHFGPIDSAYLISQYPNSLIIGTSEEILKEANIIKRIYGSNGFEYFDVVAN